MKTVNIQSPIHSPGRVILFAALLAAAVLWAYHPAWNGGFIWDDDEYIVKNDLLVAPDGLRRIWFSLDSPSQYFPLVYTSFRIERAVWDLNPTGYHIVNLILHIASVMLLWRLLVRLKIPGAWFAAAIFALHPVQVESVAWITERKNVLMGFFFISSLLTWTAFVERRDRRRWWWYGIALTGYALALLSKTTACTEPAALLLILWWTQKPITGQRIVQIVPFVLLGIFMGLVTIWWERYHQGTSASLFSLGPVDRLLIASRALWFYLAKLIWPAKLTFIYPQWSISASHLIDYIWLLACLAGGFGIWLTRRYVGRSVETAILYFAATLSPVLGFIMLYTFRYTYVADHYQYLACIGPVTLAAGGVWFIALRLKLTGLFTGVALAVIAGLAVLTWRQTAMYGNIETLWRQTIARNPDCWMAHNNLGVVLVQNGAIDEAIVHYRRTLELQPDYQNANYNLGNALLQKGQIDEALRYSRKAVEMRPRDAEARVALANALFQRGSGDDALNQYDQALAIRPFSFSAQYNLSAALLARGDLDGAILHARAAARIRPNDANSQINLAIALSQKGEIRQAIAAYNNALVLAPGSIPARNNLAWLLATCPDPALRDGSKALRLALETDQAAHHASAVVLRTLAAAYAENGHFKDAVGAAEEGLSLAKTNGDTELQAELEQQLSAYRAGSPYRESSH